MPTPRLVQAIVRQRTSLSIDRQEANRLMGIAMSHPAPDEPIEVHGRDRRTGAPASAQLTVSDVLMPPDDFVTPA
jgi:actin-like ATPase involved in cell morphogenesis